jgi:hypothetical protein
MTRPPLPEALARSPTPRLCACTGRDRSINSVTAALLLQRNVASGAKFFTSWTVQAEDCTCSFINHHRPTFISSCKRRAHTRPSQSQATSTHQVAWAPRARCLASGLAADSVATAHRCHPTSPMSYGRTRARLCSTRPLCRRRPRRQATCKKASARHLRGQRDSASDRRPQALRVR